MIIITILVNLFFCAFVSIQEEEAELISLAEMVEDNAESSRSTRSYDVDLVALIKQAVDKRSGKNDQPTALTSKEKKRKKRLQKKLEKQRVSL